MTIYLTVNGNRRSVDVDPIRRLANVLREDLGLTGTKIGCDAGDCGACTVLVDGEQICSCMTPVAQVSGKSITTVEGLADESGELNQLQTLFHQNGAAQCGICTPGMLMAATSLLASCPNPSEAEILDAMGGVLCRCTGYRKIVDAIKLASQGVIENPPPPDVGEAMGAPA